MDKMFVALSDAGWAAIGVMLTAVTAAVASIVTAIVNLRGNRQTRAAIDDAAVTNSADHGTVALALSKLVEEVKDNHRRNGERFERLGQRVGDLATRQETMMTSVTERIDHVGGRIDDVISSQRDHLQHHLDRG